MTSITSLCEMACQLPVCYDDDDDEERSDSLYNIISGLPSFSAIIPNEPVLSTEEPDNSLSMGDEHLDTISVTESDKVIKSSVENLIPIPNQIKDFSESNEEFYLIEDYSFFIDNIDYVEVSPPDYELVSSEVMEIVISKVGGINDDILLTIKDDILREKLLNVNLLIAKIKALNANPTPSSDCMTKSSSNSLNSLLEETNTFDNSLPEFETFCFDVEEISSGSITTPSDISLLEYEAFYDDHTDMVIHIAKTEKMKLMVEIKCVGINADEFDKETRLSDRLQPKQPDLTYIPYQFDVGYKFTPFRMKSVQKLCVYLKLFQVHVVDIHIIEEQ
nr:hypothetical protein [Tanacetum cinerariifolium]